MQMTRYAGSELWNELLQYIKGVKTLGLSFKIHLETHLFKQDNLRLFNYSKLCFGKSF